MHETILVIDPQEMVRAVLTDILKRSGYQVRQAPDLHEAIAAVQDCHPDLVVTNVYIPGGSGDEASRQLRQVCPGVRVLIVAGLPDDSHIQEHWGNEAEVEVFPKPFTAQELTSKVRAVLDSTVSA